MRKRLATGIGIAAGALATLAAHTAYWYLPRERPGVPSEAAAERLAGAAWDVVVWVPYPHQNLGALERQVGDLRRWIEGIVPPGRAAVDRLPSFGPWAVPPAGELVVAQRGEEVQIELAVFPSVAWVARAAGRVAANPWLAGGDVDSGEGRRGRVEWVAGRWRWTGVGRVAGEEGRRAPTARPAGEVSLAWIRLGRPLGWLPEGLYRGAREADGLALSAGPLPDFRSPPLGETEPLPAAWLVERKGRGAAGGTIVWPDEGPVPPFPAAVALGRGAGSKRRIPGEELLRLAGRAPERTTVAGWSLRALSEEEIERGRPLVEPIARWLHGRPRLGLVAGVRPAGLSAAARRLSNRFGGLPLGDLLGTAPRRLEALLAPLAGCPVSILEVWDRPPAVRWRLCLDEPAAVELR